VPASGATSIHEFSLTAQHGNVYSTTCCTPPKWSAEDLLSGSKLSDVGAGDIAQELQNLHKYHALYRSEGYQPFAHVRLAEP
jgi:hypothetical protein